MSKRDTQTPLEWEAGTIARNQMKKPKKRIPVPKKPPKVEKSKKAYDRKRQRQVLQKILAKVDNDK
mgnify:CR=1 FL=1